MEPMAESLALHIARNPWGHSEAEKRAAALRLADLCERWKRAGQSPGSPPPPRSQELRGVREAVYGDQEGRLLLECLSAEGEVSAQQGGKVIGAAVHTSPRRSAEDARLGPRPPPHLPLVLARVNL